MSKKKTLLNENSIRRFMKLAEIDGLSDQFVAKNFMNEEDEELEMKSDDGEVGMDAEMEGGEVEMDPDDGEVEMDAEMEGGEVEAEISPEAAEAIVDLAAQLENAGVGGEVEDEVEMPVEDEEEEMMEDQDLGIDMVNEENDEDLMEALTKRVMKRLSHKRSLHEAKQKKAKRLEEVADRVWDRIVKSSK